MSSKYKMVLLVDQSKLKMITELLENECVIASTMLCDTDGNYILSKPKPIQAPAAPAPAPAPVKPAVPVLRQLPDELNKQPRAIYRFLEAEGTKSLNEIGNFLSAQGWAHTSASSAISILKQMNLVRRNADGTFDRI